MGEHALRSASGRRASTRCTPSSPRSSLTNASRDASAPPLTLTPFSRSMAQEYAPGALSSSTGISIAAQRVMRRAFSIFALSILAAAGSIAQTYSITDLGTLGGPTSEANDIGSLGQIVGVSKTPDGSYHAFLYSGRAMHDLGAFGGNQSIATAINSSSQIAGYYYNGGYKAFLWTNGNEVDLGNLGAKYAAAWALNGSGQVVGDSK